MNVFEIKINLKSEDLRHIIERFHFRKEDFTILQALNKAIASLLQIKAYYIWQKKDEKISYNEYAVVFLTLGEGIDRLQEKYLAKKCLSEAYMVECIALEILSKAYKEFIKVVQHRTGKWVEKLDFLGDTYPITLLPELYQKFWEMDISYNEKMVLSPKKSVVFLLPVSDVPKEADACDICENCSNSTCLLR